METVGIVTALNLVVGYEKAMELLGERGVKERIAARAVKKEVVVVRSSRVATRTVDGNVEVNDDELGFIASDELNRQKSRILLALAMLTNAQPTKLQELFRTY